MIRISSPQSRKPQRGFTLVELMVAIVIVGILAAIALPAYQSQRLRGNRAVARAALIDLTQRQEQWRLKTRVYAETFEPIIDIDDTSVFLDREGGFADTQQGDSIYRLAFVGTPTENEFRLRATAVANQTADEECRWIEIFSSGRRNAQDIAGEPNPDCWTR